MSNAGGAWDNAKKIGEVDLEERNTPLHEASVIGDTVGDPFKDTSSVSMNQVINFTTLFGLLALELALELSRTTNSILTVIFVLISVFFVSRSFYSLKVSD